MAVNRILVIYSRRTGWLLFVFISRRTLVLNEIHAMCEALSKKAPRPLDRF
jgi:hypothetical protein